MAVVDLETTGFPGDPAAAILEFGALLLDPGCDDVGVVNTLLAQDAAIPAPITRLTGLREEDVRGAPRLAAVAPELRSALRGRRLIAHNAEFERFFLNATGLGSPDAPPDLDTQDLLALCHPDAPDLRLESFTRLLLGREERHRALADAIDTAAVLSAIAVAGTRGEPRYALAHDALERYAPGSPWSPLLAGNRVGSGAKSAAPLAPSSRDVPEAPVPFDEDAIEAVLRDAARGARHFEGYRVREEQVALARSVIRALQGGEVLLLEGGTGVGKSLAYLAALIPWSVDARGDGRAPVVISTRTKLLQDQLLDKDIPAAAAFLGYPELRALSIKGRANYACERRLAAALADGLEAQIFPDDRFAYAILASSAAIRPGGEVAALPGAWLRRYPALVDLLRRSVAARAEQCTREQCAKHPECPLGVRRSALAGADLVVANHDLLLRWPADYPAFSHVVVDEAHELSAVADEVYAETVRPSELIERLDDLFGRPGDGGGLLPAGKRRAFRRDALAWRRALQQDFVALGRALEPHASEFGEVQIPAGSAAEADDPFAESPSEDLRFADAVAVADAAAARLEQVAREVESELEAPPDAGQARNLDDLRDAATSLRRAFAGSEDAVASFHGVVPPYDTWTLAVRPLTPAPAFREALLDRVETFVGVSASLLIAGTAFAALGELEIEESAGERLVRASVPSPFPYAEQMRVVALRDRGDLVTLTAEAIERLAIPLGGRTLGLFTSLRRMREVADQLVPVLRAHGIEVISPRRASDDPSALLERFRRGRTVLLGARKFWQGVDLPGDALQAVVIEKLPFEVPTELRRRREARLRRAGRDPFAEATLGKMLLNLKQMAGRLIRSEEDRGVVVLVEGRSDRRYFRRLAEALPPGCPLETGEIRDLDGVLKELGLPER